MPSATGTQATTKGTNDSKSPSYSFVSFVPFVVKPSVKHGTLEKARAMRLTHPDTLAGRARGLDRGLGLALAGTLGLLVAGWTWPMMTVSRFVWLQDEVSLLNATRALYAQGDWLLFGVLAVFAFLFPMAKLIAALWIFLIVDARRRSLIPALEVLDLLGRWSMLDVFVAALLVVAVQASLVSEVTLHAGLYLFTAAVVASIAATQRLRVLARRARDDVAP